MDMTIRAMKPDERNYSYTQEKSVQKIRDALGICVAIWAEAARIFIQAGMITRLR